MLAICVVTEWMSILIFQMKTLDREMSENDKNDSETLFLAYLVFNLIESYDF